MESCSDAKKSSSFSSPRPQLLRLVVAVVRDARMTESSSDSSMAMSFGSMIDGMVIFSAMFSADSIRWSPPGLPFASYMSMKSGSVLQIQRPQQTEDRLQITVDDVLSIDVDQLDPLEQPVLRRVRLVL